MGVIKMKRFVLRFLIYFSLFFIMNLVTNTLFKDDPNVLTAFSVALGVSFGIAFFEYSGTKKRLKKEEKYSKKLT